MFLENKKRVLKIFKIFLVQLILLLKIFTSEYIEFLSN